MKPRFCEKRCLEVKVGSDGERHAILTPGLHTCVRGGMNGATYMLAVLPAVRLSLTAEFLARKPVLLWTSQSHFISLWARLQSR